MATLAYAPAIQAHIRLIDGSIVDISNDLVSWTLTLRENAPHTFDFKLQNTRRKYDGQFAPMCAITIRLKRIKWVQVFTGYLNDSPVFQAWPGTLDMSATCTLKRCQFWFWDPTTSPAQQLAQSAMAVQPGDATTGDNGLQRLIVDGLTQVNKWPKDRIHIGQVPNDWFKIISSVIKQIGVDEALYNTLGSSYTLSGETSGLAVPLPPGGDYDGESFDAAQARNASLVYSALLSMGITSDSIMIMTFMCIFDESHFRMYANANNPASLTIPHDAVGSDHGSVGLYQQQVGGAPNSTANWGTVQQLMDVSTSTQKFVNALIKKLPMSTASRGGDSLPLPISTSQYGYFVQAVQGSAGDGSNYQAFLGAAQALLAALQKAATAAGATAGTVNGSQVIGPGVAAGPASGGQIAKVAQNLIESRTSDPIHYREGGPAGQDDPANTPLDQVTYLDCSSLVDWVYYHTTGNWLSGTKGQRTNVAAQISKCKLISVDAAANVQGALLLKGPNDHVGISLGDGKNHVAAHEPGIPLIDQVNISPIAGNGFNIGGLLPGIDYSQAAGTQTAAQLLNQAGVKTSGLAVPLTSVADPGLATSTGNVSSDLGSLLNQILFTTDTSGIGQALGGPIALINDVPFLPWLQNVTNAAMRSFCSAPNGDFIAWFPDYFGYWGTCGAMDIELIELQDFQVQWSDQQIVTHQYVLGGVGVASLDFSSGAIGAGPSQLTDLVHVAQGSSGIASFDFPEIFSLIYGQTLPQSVLDQYLARFGGRPDVQQMPYVPKGAPEFFMATYLFTQRWASQFTASIPLTFMPELFPGMLLRIPDYGFQAYVQQVVHSGSYGEGGNFSTQVSVCAPSNIGKPDRNDLLSLLPIGGKVSG